jgi:prophage regulatory protein
MIDTDTRLVLPEDLHDFGIPYTNTHRRRLEAADKFPRRVPLSFHRYGYVYEELIAWNRARIAERDAKLSSNGTTEPEPAPVDPPSPKKRGWPKGKPRGPRSPTPAPAAAAE